MDRENLINELTRLGHSYRRSKKMVDVVFDEIKKALARGEVVRLPFGTFEVVEHTRQPLRAWTLNRVRVTYKKRNFIKFTLGEV